MSDTTPLSGERIAELRAHANKWRTQHDGVIYDVHVVEFLALLDMASRSLNAGGDAGGDELVARLHKLADHIAGLDSGSGDAKLLRRAANALTAMQSANLELLRTQSAGLHTAASFARSQAFLEAQAVAQECADNEGWDAGLRRVGKEIAAAIGTRSRALTAATPGRGERTETAFCAPLDDQKPMFMLRFYDPEQGYNLYEDEAEARAAWERYCGPSGNWNGCLFGLLRRESAPLSPPPETEDAIVERVAVAICESEGGDPLRMTYQLIPGESVQEPYGEAWLHFIDQAKAALDAMRKPT